MSEQYFVFRDAVQALDSGDIQRLETLLDQYPWLISYHCRTGEPYEEGYFAGATLLNHIAGNPSRCPIPSNIVDITRLLLSRGARDEPPRPKYTIGLLLTSKQASEAGGQLETVKMLIERNAPLEVKNMYGGTVLGQALWSAFNEPHKDHLRIVEFLIAAGAQIEPDWNKWIDKLRHRDEKYEK